ncbi:hypothetical protein [Roseiterribacter gracilis]|uniref:Uncharacterized protein n=1 Tax=Roseiterribacter gracilis TaxID=2812848 RepID=A0A8S8XEU2_9PROT|nr:hypothetical protein TMPK1_33710 [Rhodospirillales bacterium TMPK1]
MSLRTSIILLSLAFSALVAIVVATLVAGAPRDLEAELEQRRQDLKTSPAAPVFALPDLRDAPRTKCGDRFDQYRSECRSIPTTKPATFAR